MPGVADVICVDHTNPESLKTTLCVAVRVMSGADREALLETLSDAFHHEALGQVRHQLFDEFPVTPAGKPDRRAIRRWFEDQA